MTPLKPELPASNKLLAMADMTSGSGDGSDSLGDKLSREVHVIGGGIVEGTRTSLDRALTDPMTAVKLGGSLIVGTALTAASGRKGLVAAGAKLVGLGLGLAFGKELFDQGKNITAVAADTWNNPGNLAANRANIASHMGPFLVDSAIYTAGGLSGVKLGQRFLPAAGETAALSGGTKIQEKIDFNLLEQGKGFEVNPVSLTTDSPLGASVAAIKPSMAHVEALTLTDGRLGGGHSTGVAVGEGQIAVNRHSVKDAISVTVFDGTGNPHPARVSKLNPDKEVDLAILQLENPESFKSFSPAAMAEAVALDGRDIAIVGHPLGQSELFVSPGTVKNHRGLNISIAANVHPGNSGSAVIDMSGKLLGIMRSEGSAGVNATPSSYVRNLLDLGLFDLDAPASVGSAKKPGRTLASAYEVDAPAALKVVDGIFGENVSQGVPPDFFHAKVRRAGDLLLKTEYSPNTSEITVTPITVHGRPVGQALWPGTDIPISSSRLNLKFSDGFTKVSMNSVNDPTGALLHGLELSGGQASYLSMLKPSSAGYRSIAGTSNRFQSFLAGIKPYASGELAALGLTEVGGLLAR
ncbi:MAG: trypsin-like peptidase domain-containing protein [Cyanobacteria bacterium HKST-UBA02]|nr:trypsin-like peptidase domain-containing protein [Cyanobacteria bacterium HKST-UBA02]